MSHFLIMMSPPSANRFLAYKYSLHLLTFKAPLLISFSAFLVPCTYTFFTYQKIWSPVTQQSTASSPPQRPRLQTPYLRRVTLHLHHEWWSHLVLPVRYCGGDARRNVCWHLIFLLMTPSNSPLLIVFLVLAILSSSCRYIFTLVSC